MKLRTLAAALACCLTFTPVVLAQAPKGGEKKAAPPKSAADLAVDAWNKARNDPAGKTAAGFANVVAAGMSYVAQYPTHGQISSVINQLATFAGGIDPKQPALRASFISQLKLEVTNQRYKDGVTDPVKAALAAIDAAVADFEMRQSPGRDGLVALREKIDALAETPGATRFLGERERSYAHLLILMNQSPRAEEQLKKLATHADKGIAGMAKQELTIIETKKTPFELKFTGLDGKETDLAQLRGKVVALVIWNTGSKGFTDNLERLKMLHSDYRKRGFEVVTVCYDKEEDRAKVQKYVKDNRINWPVHFDGTAGKNSFAAKLNADNSNLPRAYLFDKAGLLQTIMPAGRTDLTPNVPLTQLEPHVKRLLGIK